MDTETLEELRTYWEPIKGRLIQEVDRDYGVYVPTSGKRINRNSPSGRLIIDTACEYGIDPQDLAAEAIDMHRGYQEGSKGHLNAVKNARRTTGLTKRRIARWENRGRDYSTWPGLDTKARELASDLPDLRIGQGYVQGENYDDTDYAAQLWTLLRDTDDRLPGRYDPEILEQAAARVAKSDSRCDYHTHRFSFSAARFADYLARNGIPWPRLESGALDFSDETFRQMARMHPEVAKLRELRHTLGQLRLESLAVGTDGRNRCLLSPFQSITG
ncbi:unnamed protein product, partial [marine sediment metagenome]